MSRCLSETVLIIKIKINVMAIDVGLVAAGASVLGQGIGAFSQGRLNKKMRKWNERMYGVQRADALADWNMMNEYNSPEAQMARFEAAGLNPNLIYGSSNEGAVVRSANVDSWRPQAIQFDPSEAVMGYSNVTSRAAQTDNVKAATDVAKQEAALKAVEITSKLIGIDRSKIGVERDKFNLSQAQKLADVSLESAAEQLRKTKAEVGMITDSNERAAASNAQSLQKGVEEILNLREQRAKTREEVESIKVQRRNIYQDYDLRQLDLELKKLGIQPSDNIFLRIIGRLLEGYGFGNILRGQGNK